MAEQVIAIAKVKGLKISPRKVAEVVGLVRGKKVSEGEKTLKFLPKRSAHPVLLALRSASANAKVKAGSFNSQDWIISKITADRGPIYSRKLDMKPRLQRGIIRKRSTHLTIEIKKVEGLSKEGGKHGT